MVPLELTDVVNRTPAFWRKLGDKCVNLIKRITNQGTDFEGKTFPPYSAAYAKRKAKGRTTRMKPREGEAEAGAGTRQSSRRISPPDLRFTGDMMKDLKTLATDKESAFIGWATFGDRVQWNAEMGRAVIDFAGDDLHPQVTAAIVEALELDTQEKIDAWAKVPININIGRK